MKAAEPLERGGGLIVCESHGTWALALGRLLPQWRGLLQETRNEAQCHAALTASPASFVVIELTREKWEGALGLLAKCTVGFPAAVVAVSVEVGLDMDEWTLRELGAAQVVRSRREAQNLAVMSGRHLARRYKLPRNEFERALARLPWSIERD